MPLSAADSGPERRAPAVFMIEPEARTMTAGGFGTSGEAGIEIRGFSLAKAVLGLGVLLILSSFISFLLNDGSGLSSLGFIYSLPVLLIGSSLAYAEIQPAGLKATPSLEALFERKATETMKSISSDVTRHRYGDEAHLDTTVKRLGLVLPNKAYPQLQYIEYQNAEGGELSMMCVWESLDTPFRLWAEPERVKRYDTFFGPDLWCETVKVDGAKKLVGIKMTTGARPAPPVAEAPASAAAAEATEASGTKAAPPVAEGPAVAPAAEATDAAGTNAASPVAAEPAKAPEMLSSLPSV